MNWIKQPNNFEIGFMCVCVIGMTNATVKTDFNRSVMKKGIDLGGGGGMLNLK